jgi:glyoxylase-like metal-dependent hydrolase (beta-lactamase superfamily II)
MDTKVSETKSPIFVLFVPSWCNNKLNPAHYQAMSGNDIIFEQIRSGGCLSYVLGCAQEKACIVIDPEIDKTDDYAGLVEFFGAKLLYVIDTHTHADHNSACKLMRERYGVKVVMHRATDAPYVDVRVEDGEDIRFGTQKLKVIYTPGHTQDAMCLMFDDRIFTGDTLLIGGCGLAVGPSCHELRLCLGPLPRTEALLRAAGAHG